MSPFAKLTLVAAAILLVTPSGRMDAQAPTRRLPRPKEVCSMVMSVVSVRLVDRDGKAVRGGTVRMTRLRDGKSLGEAAEMSAGSGEFQIVESTALSWIAPEGDRIRLVAKAGRRSAVGVVRVGRDPSGCRLVKLSGPGVLKLK